MRAEPWLRLLADPAAAYVPSTPPWLAVAAAVAACAPTDDERRAALPPPVAAAVVALAEAAAAGGVEALLGAAARDQLFMLEPGTTYLNHGRQAVCWLGAVCWALHCTVLHLFLF